MGIQSLGVGSGLALDDLVTQLIAAEREPREARLTEREEQLDATISGIGQLQSRLGDFQESITEITRNFSQSTRTATISNPQEDDDESTDDGAIGNVDAASGAARGDFDIVVNQLAAGSRIETAAGQFTDSSASVLNSGSGSLTFEIPNSSNSFTIPVGTGTSLTQLRDAINSNDNNFGVTASIVNTGTSDGARLVFSSTVSGTGNDLVIRNDNDLADLDFVSTVGSDGTAATNNLTAVQSARNAQAVIDGIVVESDTNVFENTVENVSFEAFNVSPLDTDGVTRQTSRLNVGFDTEGFESNIRDFVDNFNDLISEVETLTRFGESDLEEDGSLAGDFLPRNVLGGINNILSSAVSNSELATLFQIGLSFNDEGRLEITNFDDIGLGSGEDRLDDALEDNFDDIVTLFNDPEEGIATRLDDFIREFTRAGGLLGSRQSILREERDSLFDERARLELQLLNSEQILRDRFINLDQTVSSLNRTGSALFAALGG